MAVSTVPSMDASIVRRPPFGSNPLVGERGTDTQRRILAAALEVFAEVGFAETRVELITERAGCSRPAFYQYFSSKDDVFWGLAGLLGTEMVTLAKRLGKVTPDAEGLAHLTEWIDAFMGLHEAWAPVFGSFQAASRDHQPQARSSSAIADRTGLALLRAFGAPEDERNGALVTGVVGRPHPLQLLRRAGPGRDEPPAPGRGPGPPGAPLARRTDRGRERRALRPAPAPPGGRRRPRADGRRPTAAPAGRRPGCACSRPAARCCPPAATTTPAWTTWWRRPGSATAPSTGTSPTWTTSSGCWPRTRRPG